MVAAGLIPPRYMKDQDEFFPPPDGRVSLDLDELSEATPPGDEGQFGKIQLKSGKPGILERLKTVTDGLADPQQGSRPKLGSRITPEDVLGDDDPYKRHGRK